IGSMEIFPKGIDLPAATRQGILVSGLPNLDIISDSTAELAISVMLALGRRITQGERVLRDGDWHQYQSMRLLGTLHRGKTLGIIGFGKVGSRIAQLGFGLGMRVVYSDPAQARASQEDELRARHVSLDDLLRISDVIV